MKLSPFWSGMTVALAILSTIIVFDYQYRHRLDAGQQAEVAHELILLGARIEGLVDKYRYLGAGLAAYLTTHPDVSPQEFAALLRRLSSDDSLLRGVAVLHGGTPTHAYVAPPRTHADSAVVRLSIAVPAADGMRSGAARQIDLDLDRATLLEQAGMFAPHRQLQFAVRSHDGRLLAGRPEVLAAAQAEVAVILPEGNWILAGHARSAPLAPSWPLLLSVACALLGGFLTWRLRYNQLRTHRLALHDCLTGLPNRRLLQDRVQQACAAAARSRRQIVLMYLDLDNFKPVNDNYGHHAGDAVLREVAQRLQACVRRSDTVARVSGDEFVLVLDALAETTEAETVADKVLATFARPIVVGEHAFVLGCSIGLVAMEAGCDVDQALVRADSAMYQAKRDGKNSYRWYVSEPEQLTLEVAAETAV